MLFPKDRPIFPVLRTSFTKFDALIDELATDGATGCLSAVFQGSNGAILFLDGTPAASVFHEAAKRFTGPEAARKIHAAATRPGGMIEVYALDEQVLQSLVRGLDAVPLYENLSTDFASPERLFARRGCGHGGGHGLDAAGRRARDRARADQGDCGRSGIGKSVETDFRFKDRADP